MGNVDVVPIRTCARNWAVRSNIGFLPFNPFVIQRRYEVCTSVADGKSACFGDSGSALVCDGKVSGIVSFGDIECRTDIDAPNVYTRISPYVEWIQGVTEDDGGGGATTTAAPLTTAPVPSP